MKEKFNIKYIAQLAKIELTKDQQKKFCRELKKILEFVEKLNALDVSDVSALSHIVEEEFFKEDKVFEFLAKEDILKNAPQRKENFFVVPKIVEK